ncbi:MAG: hypothetical protein L0Y66_09040 [Myxococcaceae bacterium]|nr:hypothetical protein [Myxococcaceae bacterium]MCI0673475.1 hypothetical protein [Myxococcaceae bacterium]
MKPVMRVAVGVLALGLLVACPGEVTECPEPTYAGGTTDEAWRALQDASANTQAGSGQAATLTAPDAVTPLHAGDAAPTLRWTSPLAQRVVPRHLPVGRGVRSRSMLARAWEAVTEAVLPTAHAHGTPLTGDAYLVSLSVPGQRCPAQHFTTELQWTLSQEAWDAVRAGEPHEVTVTLTSAEFRENAVTAGPYRPATSTTFQVQP